MLAALNDNITFTCIADKNRSILWYVNGAKVWNGRDLVNVDSRYNVTEQKTSTYTTSWLSIVSVTTNDIGLIACQEVGSNYPFGAELAVMSK